MRALMNLLFAMLAVCGLWAGASMFSDLYQHQTGDFVSISVATFFGGTGLWAFRQFWLGAA